MTLRPGPSLFSEENVTLGMTAEFLIIPDLLGHDEVTTTERSSKVSNLIIVRDCISVQFRT